LWFREDRPDPFVGFILLDPIFVLAGHLASGGEGVTGRRNKLARILRASVDESMIHSE
jgi:hypothetical protein